MTVHVNGQKHDDITLRLHEDAYVKFEVEGFEHTVSCTISVKQGDVLGPVL